MRLSLSPLESHVNSHTNSMTLVLLLFSQEGRAIQGQQETFESDGCIHYDRDYCLTGM